MPMAHDTKNLSNDELNKKAHEIVTNYCKHFSRTTNELLWVCNDCGNIASNTVPYPHPSSNYNSAFELIAYAEQKGMLWSIECEGDFSFDSATGTYQTRFTSLAELPRAITEAFVMAFGEEN